MKKNQIILSIVAVLILALCGTFVIMRTKMNEDSLPRAKSYAITVSGMKAELKPVKLTLPYLAQTQNDKDVNLSSRVSARVEFMQRSGKAVKKGEIVARFDNASFESTLKSLEAQLSAQKIALGNLISTHKRTTELLAVKGASIEQSETEEGKIALLEAGIESIKQNLNDIHNSLTYTTIRSPVDGQISKTLVNTGDMIMPGQPVATVSANSDFYLLLLLPTDLKVFGVLVDNKPYEIIPLNNTFNNLAQYKVYVDPENRMSGDRIEVNVVVFDGMAIKLPFDAVLNREGSSYVLSNYHDKAVAIKVNIIQSGEEGVVISNNELAGKQIIVARQDVLLTLLSGISIKMEEK
jgi:multidrug efflux pump subunit AcrA (membrane-fusion protein)